MVGEGQGASINSTILRPTHCHILRYVVASTKRTAMTLSIEGLLMYRGFVKRKVPAS